jgi:DNA-binding NarL/FixJ family response regulator
VSWVEPPRLNNGTKGSGVVSAPFVTPKTVEYHLRNAYRKLDIHTRRQLAGALSE